MSLNLRVNQKFREPLDELAALFGGTVRRTSRGYFDWTVTSKQAGFALRNMLPFLILKKRQAEVALAYQSAVQSHRGSTRLTEEERVFRLWCFQELRDLKR